MSLSFPTLAAIRFGYGLRPGEAPPADAEALLAQAAAPKRADLPFTALPLARRRQLFLAMRARNRAVAAHAKPLPPEERVPLLKAQGRDVQLMLLAERQDRLSNAVLSPHGFHERLAAFWVDHFSTNIGKSGDLRQLVPMQERDAIRPHLTGRFADLLSAAVRHPAMLLYLDQQASFGPNSPVGSKQKRGLNENLARELIELHTMGAGSGYSQTDVTSAARVLTGLVPNAQRTDWAFLRQRAEPGAHPVLGTTYGGSLRSERDVEHLLADLAARPQTAAHLCRKLAAHFIADQPPAALVSAMTQAWRRSDGDLMAVYRVLVTHKDGQDVTLGKIKPPFDYVASSLRALDIDQATLDAPRPSARKAAPERAAMLAAETEEAAKQSGAAGRQTMSAMQDGADAKEPGGEAMMTNGAAALIRTLGKPGDRLDALLDERLETLAARRKSLSRDAVQTIAALGQPIWQPPSPAGWPDTESAWIGGGALTGRIAWARRLGASFGGDEDPTALLKDALGEAARDDTIRTVSRAPRRQVGLTLALASPEFNRR